MQLCDDLAFSSLIQNNELICWINDMKDYVQRTTQGSVYLPISDPAIFQGWLLKFAYNTTIG